MDTGRLSYSQHISAKFNTELGALKQSLLEMGGTVEQQIDLALDALLERDSALAERAIEMDQAINKMELSIDEQCARILALRQPAASDLRLILATTKLTIDLERIGDEASKIARVAIDLAGDSQFEFSGTTTRTIADHINHMLRMALDAYARIDANSALSVIMAESEVETLHQRVHNTLVDRMRSSPADIERYMKLLWALRSLERIGDHAVNIGEQVIYLVRGKDVRHQGTESISKLLGDT